MQCFLSLGDTALAPRYIGTLWLMKMARFHRLVSLVGSGDTYLYRDLVM